MSSSTRADEVTSVPRRECHHGRSHARYFSYKKVARQAHIPLDALAHLCQSIREELPTDDMMYEFHVLRACMAVRGGYARLEDTLPQEPAAIASR